MYVCIYVCILMMDADLSRKVIPVNNISFHQSLHSLFIASAIDHVALMLRSLRLNTPVCVASRYFEHKPTSLSHRKAIVAIKVFRQAKRSEKQLVYNWQPSLMAPAALSSRYAATAR